VRGFGGARAPFYTGRCRGEEAGRASIPAVKCGIHFTKGRRWGGAGSDRERRGVGEQTTWLPWCGGAREGGSWRWQSGGLRWRQRHC
jgi:hypothetical protein